jgi:hypothetical protein
MQMSLPVRQTIKRHSTILLLLLLIVLMVLLAGQVSDIATRVLEQSALALSEFTAELSELTEITTVGDFETDDVLQMCFKHCSLLR